MTLADAEALNPNKPNVGLHAWAHTHNYTFCVYMYEST